MKATRNEQNGRWTLQGVEPSEQTFERICSMLRNNENFKLARYGDGELNCIRGKKGANCDGHEYFEDLGKALLESLQGGGANYFMGIQPLAYSIDPGFFHTHHFKNVIDADVLHSASIDGKVFIMVHAMEGRNVILVGPKHLKNIKGVRNIHIITNDKNCWEQFDQIIADLELVLESKENAVVLLCASMMSEVLIYRFKDSPHTFIDCGSVFDPYCGVNSRSYHKKLCLS